MKQSFLHANCRADEHAHDLHLAGWRQLYHDKSLDGDEFVNGKLPVSSPYAKRIGSTREMLDEGCWGPSMSSTLIAFLGASSDVSSVVAGMW